MTQITGEFELVRKEIIDNHPTFDKLRDSRITIFTNCIVALDGVYVCFIVRSFELWEDEWWMKMRSKIDEIRTPAPRNEFIKGFDSFTVTSYFNLLFIALENGFRTFYKPVCPLKKKPIAFFNVYDDILKELQLTRYFKLMQILRMVRNAMMHQNGIYEGKDEEIEWYGKTIRFRRGKSVDFGGEVWEGLPSISQGIVNMLKNIVNSGKIIQEPKIIDPSYARI
jgi:hypothetical protein